MPRRYIPAFSPRRGNQNRIYPFFCHGSSRIAAERRSHEPELTAGPLQTQTALSCLAKNRSNEDENLLSWNNNANIVNSSAWILGKKHYILTTRHAKNSPFTVHLPTASKAAPPCKESILLPNLFLHSTMLSEPNCWTNFNFDFNSSRLLYLGDCLLEWRRAVDTQVYKYPEPALVTRGSFCYRNCSAASKKPAVPSAAAPDPAPHLNLNSGGSVAPRCSEFRKHHCISN